MWCGSVLTVSDSPPRVWDGSGGAGGRGRPWGEGNIARQEEGTLTTDLLQSVSHGTSRPAVSSGEGLKAGGDPRGGGRGPRGREACLRAGEGAYAALRPRSSALEPEPRACHHVLL